METINCTNCQTSNKASNKYCSSCGYELPKPLLSVVESQTQEPPSTSSAKKRWLGLAVSALAFLLSYYAVQEIFFKPPSFDKLMMQVASEINKNCPFMVDQFTRLDNSVALPDNSFQYNYTLVEVTKDEVIIDTVKKYIEPNILNTVKTNPDLKFFRDNKTTLIYNYKDMNGEFVHKFSVTPEMYQ
jgi:hypothetical protein